MRAGAIHLSCLSFMRKRKPDHLVILVSCGLLFVILLTVDIGMSDKSRTGVPCYRRMFILFRLAAKNCYLLSLEYVSITTITVHKAYRKESQYAFTI